MRAVAKKIVGDFKDDPVIWDYKDDPMGNLYRQQVAKREPQVNRRKAIAHTKELLQKEGDISS